MDGSHRSGESWRPFCRFLGGEWDDPDDFGDSGDFGGSGDSADSSGGLELASPWLSSSFAICSGFRAYKTCLKTCYHQLMKTLGAHDHQNGRDLHIPVCVVPRLRQVFPNVIAQFQDFFPCPTHDARKKTQRQCLDAHVEIQNHPSSNLFEPLVLGPRVQGPDESLGYNVNESGVLDGLGVL